MGKSEVEAVIGARIKWGYSSRRIVVPAGPCGKLVGEEGKGLFSIPGRSVMCRWFVSYVKGGRVGVDETLVFLLYT